MLIVVVWLAEVVPGWMGGDLGSFLYVTLHFILVPLLSLCIAVLTVVKTSQVKAVSKKFWTLLSLVVPVAIVYLAVTGSTWLPDSLKIHFDTPH